MHKLIKDNSKGISAKISLLLFIKPLVHYKLKKLTSVGSHLMDISRQVFRYKHVHIFYEIHHTKSLPKHSISF